LGEETRRKEALGRLKRRCEDNNKMYLKETEQEGVD
jgi:hypothetical protein